MSHVSSSLLCFFLHLHSLLPFEFMNETHFALIVMIVCVSIIIHLRCLRYLRFFYCIKSCRYIELRCCCTNSDSTHFWTNLLDFLLLCCGEIRVSVIHGDRISGVFPFWVTLMSNLKVFFLNFSTFLVRILPTFACYVYYLFNKIARR